jgi:signal transduction histidine kinase
MNDRPVAEARDSRTDELLAEAQAALGYSANTLRTVRARFREHYLGQLARWDDLRDELDASERGEAPAPSAAAGTGAGTRPVDAGPADPLAAAEAGAADAGGRALRREVTALGGEVGRQRASLGRIDLALKALESAWVFLERGDDSLVGDGTVPTSSEDIQMRIVEAQEAERSRLAQEIHDGPAQALSNAIFQVEVIERVLGQDPRLVPGELRYLRDLLRRELADVRSYISQLRPPLLVELGLDGAIRDTAERMSELIGVPVDVDCAADLDPLSDAVQTVILRVVQEALQNVRKHAEAQAVGVRVAREGGTLVVEIRDDGRGFDVGAVAVRGRRNFGLQFMRERAELIGARFEVRSRPDGGTAVRLTIPAGAEEA